MLQEYERIATRRLRNIESLECNHRPILIYQRGVLFNFRSPMLQADSYHIVAHLHSDNLLLSLSRRTPRHQWQEGPPTYIYLWTLALCSSQ
jgi:hypothetical protein